MVSITATAMPETSVSEIHDQTHSLNIETCMVLAKRFHSKATPSELARVLDLCREKMDTARTTQHSPLMNVKERRTNPYEGLSGGESRVKQAQFLRRMTTNRASSR